MVLVDVRNELARDPRGAVLFDFGGTLDADGLRWSVRFHAAYARRGGRLDLEAFDPLFRASDRALETHPGIRKMGLRATIDTQARILCTLLPDGPTTDAQTIAEDVHGRAVTVVARNRTILSSLQSAYRLGIVSNFTGNLDVCLDELDLAELFDVVTDSAVLGSAKPDPRPFAVTLEALGVPANQAWVVGDNYQADIRPAQRLGMRTVWLVPQDVPDPSDNLPTARIESLTALPSLLRTAEHPMPAGQARCTA